MPSQHALSAISQSPIKTAIAASAARQGMKFAPHLAQVERQPGIRPADQKNMAAGPYGFEEQTWLRLLQAYGSQEGLGIAAEKVGTEANGARVVKDPDLAGRILALREDPDIARAMAHHLAIEQAPALTRSLGRPPSDGELYLAHILGTDRAARLIATRAANPAASATELFPEAARQLPALFGSKAAPKTVDQVMSTLEGTTAARSNSVGKPRFTDHVGHALTVAGTAGPTLRVGG